MHSRDSATQNVSSAGLLARAASAGLAGRLAGRLAAFASALAATMAATMIATLVVALAVALGRRNSQRCPITSPSSRWTPWKHDLD